MRNPARERSRNLNREVWESPSVYGGEDVNCIFGLLVLGARFFVKPQRQRSRYGEIIFNDLTNRLQPLKTANSSDSELVLAVALFGATVLMADMALADLYQMLTPTAVASSGGDGGSGGSDGSSDGGSGGGCGGCGGCGGGD